ncbi:MAG: LON peptidase substrate-binding domain-containing protein [Phycisphaerales bacterium]|nr:LON peptidase substrate-binding domain-containing protein [Phycisphaerales bacterium]
MSESVTVNFARPFPILPLPDTPLLPHSMQPLSLYESRYRDMIDQSLDRNGQVAIATVEGNPAALDALEYPPLRPVVCLGQIVQHESVGPALHVLVYGLCRAEIAETEEVNDGQRLAKLRPIGEDEDEQSDEFLRNELREFLDRPNLQRLERAEVVTHWIDQPEISTPALFELVGCSLVDDAEFRYDLLSEPSYHQRTRRIFAELHHLDELIDRADRQSQESWGKGVSWN